MATPKDPNYYSCEIRHLGYNANLDVDEKALCETVSDMLLDTAPLSREELETVLESNEWIKCATRTKSRSMPEYEFKRARHWIYWNDETMTYYLGDTASGKLPLTAVTRRLLRDFGVIA